MPPRRKKRDTNVTQFNASTRNAQHRRSRNRSISEDVVAAPGGLHRIQSLTHLPAAPPAAIFIPGPSALRRSTERLMMTCPRNT